VVGRFAIRLLEYFEKIRKEIDEHATR
jgi:hypothetical protein